MCNYDRHRLILFDRMGTTWKNPKQKIHSIWTAHSLRLIGYRLFATDTAGSVAPHTHTQTKKKEIKPNAYINIIEMYERRTCWLHFTHLIVTQLPLIRGVEVEHTAHKSPWNEVHTSATNYRTNSADGYYGYSHKSITDDETHFLYRVRKFKRRIRMNLWQTRQFTLRR